MSDRGAVRLHVQIQQLHGQGHLIGRLRLSVTGSPAPLEAAALPQAVAAILQTQSALRSSSERIELAAFVLGQRLRRELAALPAEQRVYCGTNQFEADGSFQRAVQPRPVQVLLRGEIDQPLAEATPGALALVTQLSPEFELPQPQDEAARRAALALWLANLQPPQNVEQISAASEQAGLALLQRLNREHLAQHSGDSRLASRIASYELAARMQLSAPEALDLASETAATLQAYGVQDEATFGYGRNCLIARRLLERGVRFVQVWSGTGGAKGNWDNHTDIDSELPLMARQVDQPTAALLKDLKQRGLLEDTLVVWTTEFGRMPFTQGATGRDHNGGTFVTWLAGGGVQGGVSHGESDEFSYQAASGQAFCYDLHATILHLLGIDHTRLTVRHDGVDRRLTDVHGHVIDEVLV